MDLVDGDLTLRNPQPEEAGEVVAAVHSSLAELEPWMHWATDGYDEAEALRWINGELGDVHRFVMIDSDGVIAGSCGLNDVDDVNRRANLGYWVRSDRTGRGHATTATRLLARYGLEVEGLERLEILMSTRNEASRRVAERSGAHYEGVARNRLLLRGEYHDAHVFSFVRSDLT